MPYSRVQKKKKIVKKNTDIHTIIVYIFVLFLLVLASSVLRITAFDYLFGIFKLFTLLGHGFENIFVLTTNNIVLVVSFSNIKIKVNRNFNFHVVAC